MSDKQTAAIVLVNALPQFTHFGIDTLFFTTNDNNNPNAIKGLKNIPIGLHFLHLTNELSNTRSGIFINCESDQLILISTNDESELAVDYIVSSQSNVIFKNPMVDNDGTLERIMGYGGERLLVEYVPYMINYERFINDHLNKWLKLTNKLTIGFVSKYIEAKVDDNEWFTGSITSLDSSSLEVLQLKEALIESSRLRRQQQADNTNMSRNKNTDKFLDSVDLTTKPDLKLTIIQATNKQLIKKELPDMIDPKDITKLYLDKSWFFTKKFARLSDFIIEFQFVFVCALILNNWSCLNQWYTMIKLICGSIELVNEAPEFILEFLDVFKNQLVVVKENEIDKCPKIVEVGNDHNDDDDQFINVKELTSSLKNFMKNQDQFHDYRISFKLNSFVEYVKNHFGLDLDTVYNLEDVSDDDDRDDGFFYDQSDNEEGGL